MPSPPELPDGPGNVGEREVLEELKAEHPPEADRHVGVAGEVVVDLQRVGDRGKPGHASRQVLCAEVVEVVADGSGQVCDDDLLAEAVEEAAHAGGHLLNRLLSAHDLGLDVPVHDNGSRNQLWEEGDIEGEVQEIFLHRVLLPVQVDDIAHRLEREEADADGERDLHRRDVRMEQAVHGVDRKVCIFIVAKEPKIDAHVPDKQDLCMIPEAIDQKAERPVHGDGEQKEKDISRLPPGVKQERCDEQENVLILGFPDDQARDENDRKEDPEEYH